MHHTSMAIKYLYVKKSYKDEKKPLNIISLCAWEMYSRNSTMSLKIVSTYLITVTANAH